MYIHNYLLVKNPAKYNCFLISFDTDFNFIPEDYSGFLVSLEANEKRQYYLFHSGSINNASGSATDITVRILQQQNFCKICINNVTPLAERVIHKGITRSRMGVYDPISNKRINTVVMKSNVANSTYIKHQERIQEIHNRILNNSIKYGFTKVEFGDIEKGFEEVAKTVEQWMDSL